MFIEKIREKINQRLSQKSRIFWAGIVLVAMSALLLLLTFFPVVKEEATYLFSAKDKNTISMTREEASAENISPSDVIYPMDENFGLVIPKISANAKVIDNVDWQNSKEYQVALTKGVAHAKGTSYPGEEGNVFIFSHSGGDFYEASRYNAVFYLLNKMEKGDEIDAYYQGKKITYLVSETKIIGADEVKYLDGTPGQKTLTLMTCWPAGTDWKRLIVIAELAP
jgi:LPXTG-site transpeptidase (sortase) family protein